MMNGGLLLYQRSGEANSVMEVVIRNSPRILPSVITLSVGRNNLYTLSTQVPCVHCRVGSKIKSNALVDWKCHHLIVTCFLLPIGQGTTALFILVSCLSLYFYPYILILLIASRMFCFVFN